MDEVVVGAAAVAEPSDAPVDGVLVVVVSPPAEDEVADDAELVVGEAVDVAVDASPPVGDVGVDVVAVPPVVGSGVVGSAPLEVGVVVVGSPLPEEGIEVGAGPVTGVEPLLVDGVDVDVEPPVDPVGAEPALGPDAVELPPDSVVAGWPPPELVGDGVVPPPKLLVELSDVGADVGFGPADGTPLNGDG